MSHDHPIRITVVEDETFVVKVLEDAPVGITIPEERIQVVEISNVGPRGPQGYVIGYQPLDAGGDVDFPRPTEGGPWVWHNVPSRPNFIAAQDLWVDTSG
jgi:hypothetical protein